MLRDETTSASMNFFLLKIETWSIAIHIGFPHMKDEIITRAMRAFQLCTFLMFIAKESSSHIL